MRLLAASGRGQAGRRRPDAHRKPHDASLLPVRAVATVIRTAAHCGRSVRVLDPAPVIRTDRPAGSPLTVKTGQTFTDAVTSVNTSRSAHSDGGYRPISPADPLRPQESGQDCRTTTAQGRDAVHGSNRQQHLWVRTFRFSDLRQHVVAAGGQVVSTARRARAGRRAFAPGQPLALVAPPPAGLLQLWC